MTSRPSTAAPILAVLAIVLAMLGAYVGGYFWLGQRCDWLHDGTLEFPTRFYSHRWMAIVFEPAARIESQLTGIETITDHDVPLPTH